MPARATALSLDAADEPEALQVHVRRVPLSSPRRIWTLRQSRAHVGRTRPADPPRCGLSMRGRQGQLQVPVSEEFRQGLRDASKRLKRPMGWIVEVAFQDNDQGETIRSVLRSEMRRRALLP